MGVLRNGISATFTEASLERITLQATFSGRNTGDQNPIVMNVNGCDVDGCQPRYSGVKAHARYVSDSKGSMTATTIVQSAATSAGALVSATDHISAGDSITLFSQDTLTVAGDLS